MKHFINFIGEIIYEGDVVCYTAISKGRPHSNLYIIEKIVDNNVFVRGWKQKYRFKPKVKGLKSQLLESVITTYVRKITRPKEIIHIGFHKLSDKYPFHELIREYYLNNFNNK